MQRNIIKWYAFLKVVYSKKAAEFVENLPLILTLLVTSNLLSFFKYSWPSQKSLNFTLQGRRKVGKSGGHVLLGGDNMPPLVEIGLTDRPKSGGAHAPPAPPLATGLLMILIRVRP